MRTIEQLNNDFAIYFDEIEKCTNAKCFWALLHILLTLPDVCACLETAPEETKPEVGDRYVRWCEAYLPATATISASDRYQMRNALLHSGSTSAANFGKKHHTSYVHFSYIDIDSFDVGFHATTDPDCKVLNVHVSVMAAETKRALRSWFSALQTDPIRMSYVERNIASFSRTQLKTIFGVESDGSPIKKFGVTRSST
jgi:hypothetical protein